MRKPGLVPLVIWVFMAGCGGVDGGTGGEAGSRLEFSARGTAVSADAQQIKDLPELTAGITGLAGSLALQAAQFESSDQSCVVETGPTVIIPYTLDTQFEPPEARGALLGRELTVSGELVRGENRCVPVAQVVRDEGDALNQDSPELPAPDGEGSPAEADTPKPAPAPAPAPPPAPKEPTPSPREPQALPRAAPEVFSSFRPSLPNPPTAAP